MKTLNFKNIFELVCRIYVFIFLNIYGLGKIFGGQFYTPKRIPVDVASIPLGSANGFDLAWTFMGHSYPYILFIGITQVLGAWLLLFHRTKLLGVTILIPIMLNIIVFDVIFLDKYGALASATIYFSMLLLVLFFNKDRIVEAFRILISSAGKESRNFKLLVYKYAIALIIFLIIFSVDQLLVNWFGHGKG